jgi:hypothetical protein
MRMVIATVFASVMLASCGQGEISASYSIEARVEQGGAGSVLVIWYTNVASTSLVNYGLSAGLGSASGDDLGYSNFHSVSLVNLRAGALYYYAASGRDASGRRLESPVGTFTAGGK